MASAVARSSDMHMHFPSPPCSLVTYVPYCSSLSSCSKAPFWLYHPALHSLSAPICLGMQGFLIVLQCCFTSTEAADKRSVRGNLPTCCTDSAIKQTRASNQTGTIPHKENQDRTVFTYLDICMKLL